MILAVGCKGGLDNVADKIVGDWHYQATESEVTEDVWLSLAEDGTFDLYQKIGEGVHWHIKGEYTLNLDKMTITGVYSDRYPWRYDYAFKVNSTSLTLTAVQDENYVQTYTREALPSEVVDKSLELTTKSADIMPKL